jgi:hypothetical protein
MEAHVRESLQISIDTIRVAAQSASAVLGSTVPVGTRPAERPAHKPVLDPAPAPAPAPAPPAAARRPSPAGTPRPSGGRRAPARRPPDFDDDGDGEKRPVFRRPRGR